MSTSKRIGYLADAGDSLKRYGLAFARIEAAVAAFG